MFLVYGVVVYCFVVFFFFKQKTAYELRISDWSSDVCSSDLAFQVDQGVVVVRGIGPALAFGRIGREARRGLLGFHGTSCRNLRLFVLHTPVRVKAPAISRPCVTWINPAGVPAISRHGRAVAAAPRPSGAGCPPGNCRGPRPPARAGTAAGPRLRPWPRRDSSPRSRRYNGGRGSAASASPPATPSHLPASMPGPCARDWPGFAPARSEEHTSDL